MTDTTMKTFFYTMTAKGDIKQGTTKGANPKAFASFKGAYATNNGKSREGAVTVFNTAKNPNLVADVVALLAAGPARMVVTFDKAEEGKKGQTVRIVGLGRQSAANDGEQQLDKAA